MGCFGIFSLLRKKSKRSLSTQDRQQGVCTVPNVPVQAYQPQGRTKVYESSRFRMVRNDVRISRTIHRSPQRILIRSEAEPRRSRLPRRLSDDSSSSNVVRDGQEPRKTRTQSRKPWWDSTYEELRDEFDSCRAKAPHIDVDFLWQDRRDSLEEESILAARGQISSQVRPRRGCKEDCLCSRCFARLFKEHKEHKKQSVSSDDIKLPQNSPKPSKIPGPVMSTRRDSNSSSRSSRASSRASSRSASPSRTD
ncbi:uncharacterized protein GGS22DRAFT_168548 [Annulohypoxylon maeteangense]|uniref:uncharacterized protein n=1 Tax=Annulohypoxylon maeteangense TaxID=1927788 RepID=UPI0020078EB5|nr:uncharacterized protein GGS22DRAFT_168548 [Annulohypoxylon maeteangense]KAI0882708.1 hypothetical protein GGS22DRAFT_168548 [Annulohypoxylon maeteangense]